MEVSFKEILMEEKPLIWAFICMLIGIVTQSVAIYFAVQLIVVAGFASVKHYEYIYKMAKYSFTMSFLVFFVYIFLGASTSI